MANINVGEIDNRLKEIGVEKEIIEKNKNEILKERYGDPEKIQDDYYNCFNGKDEWEQHCDELEKEEESLDKDNNKLSKKAKQLERIKEQKIVGDKYISLYPDGYKSIIYRQKDHDVDDKLNRKKEAKKICSKIESDEIKTAGIFGEWGSGKSTFLRYINEDLKENRNIQTIEIDASQYSDQEKIWAYIYEEIRKKFRASFKRRVQFFFKRIINNWPKIILNALLLIIIATLVYPVTKEVINNFTDNISILEKIGIISLYIYLYIRYILPKIIEINDFFQSTGRVFQKNFMVPNQDKVLGYKVEVIKNLNSMMEIWNEKIVLLIDEIDRSNESTVISFFETVQLFQSNEKIRIIYAVDRRVVDRALENNGIPKNDIDKYLKKYIDYGITLYSVNKQPDALKKIIDKYDFTEEESNNICEVVYKNLEVNITIRDLKEILNKINEIKGEWIKEYILSKEYNNDENYVVSFEKFIPWAIHSLTNSQWIELILSKLPLENEIVYKDIRETSFHTITLDEETRHNLEGCPKYLLDSRLMDIIIYEKFLKKYK